MSVEITDRPMGRAECADPVSLLDLLEQLTPADERRIAAAERALMILERCPGELQVISPLLTHIEAFAMAGLSRMFPGVHDSTEGAIAGMPEDGPDQRAAAWLSDSEIGRIGAGIDAILSAEHPLWMFPEHIEAVYRSVVPDAPEQAVSAAWGSERMERMCAYLSGATPSALLQAVAASAEVRAYPAAGIETELLARSLFHTVLARRGVTSCSALPMSCVLIGHADRLQEAQNHYRADRERATGYGLRTWLMFMADMVTRAAKLTEASTDRMEELLGDWRARTDEHRRAAGSKRTLRADSATARLMEALVGHPVVTVRDAAALLGTSEKSARGAIDELRGAGILRTERLPGGRVRFIAPDVLDLAVSLQREAATA